MKDPKASSRMDSNHILMIPLKNIIFSRYIANFFIIRIGQIILNNRTIIPPITIPKIITKIVP